MITLKKIDIAEIEKYVAIGFEGDNELVEKYHFSEKTLPETVDKNVSNINEMNKLYPLECYSVEVEGNPIGFTVLGKSLLYSFGINKNYRAKEILIEWVEEIKRRLEVFIVCLYAENTRAINFFEKNGMQVVERNNNVTLFYE